MKKYSINLIWISIIFSIARAMMTPYLVATFVKQTIESFLIKDTIYIIVHIQQSFILINANAFLAGLCIRFECLGRVLR